jgi:hypothetical protein
MIAIVPSKMRRSAKAQAIPMRRAPFSLFNRQLVRQDRYEDQVVDAQNHFHGDQGDQGSPRRRSGGQGQQVLKHEGSPNRDCALFTNSTQSRPVVDRACCYQKLMSAFGFV